MVTATKKRSPTQQYLRHIEQHAMTIRDRADIGPLERLDPQDSEDKLRIQIAYPDDVTALPSDMQDYLRSLDATVWSGMSRKLPDGKLLVILNPNQTVERANVTILEEIAHDYFGHEPSLLPISSNGIEKRRYDEEAEQEAYWTAAAVLLPMKVVGLAVWRQQSAEDLAEDYGASVELAQMRIKTLGLWDLYQKYAT